MKPDWKDAPPGTKWLAKDEDGAWYWYRGSERPFAGQRSWIGVLAMKTGDYDHSSDPPWFDTLERRP